MIHARHANPCHVGVDLTLMIPGGGNGGIKPAILTFLRSLGERFQNGVQFTFLVNSSTYQELESLMRPQDRMICVALTHDCPWPIPDSARGNFSVCPERKPAILRKIGLDVFYCPFGPTDRSHPAIPTVSMVTDLLHRDYPFSISETERTWREAYFKDILANADYVQCISQYTLNRLLNYYPLNKSRLFLTHLPIDQRLVVASGVMSERPYFIYPANFWVHKNHEVLLIAYRIYREKAKEPWSLVLTGNLDSRAEQIKDLARRLGIEKDVRFAGHLDETSFARVFEAAGALLFPSLHEGFGIPVVEAMRFRKPIICSRSTSIPEVAGDAVVYIDEKKPSDLAAAMTRLAEDPVLRDTLVRKGEERLKNFSITREIEKLYEVFVAAKQANSRTAKYARFLRRYHNRGRSLLGRAASPLRLAIFGQK